MNVTFEIHDSIGRVLRSTINVAFSDTKQVMIDSSKEEYYRDMEAINQELVMGTESIFKGCYITCAYDSISPYGRMVCSYKTLEEAKEHIRYQKEEMNSKARWSILHIKDCEWIPLNWSKP